MRAMIRRLAAPRAGVPGLTGEIAPLCAYFHVSYTNNTRLPGCSKTKPLNTPLSPKIYSQIPSIIAGSIIDMIRRAIRSVIISKFYILLKEVYTNV